MAEALKRTARDRLETYAHLGRTQEEQEQYDMSRDVSNGAAEVKLADELEKEVSRLCETPQAFVDAIRAAAVAALQAAERECEKMAGEERKYDRIGKEIAKHYEECAAAIRNLYEQ